MIRFPFELCPVDEIVALRADASLSWFWLTEGRYWIELGDHHLLRYSAETSARWQDERGPGAVSEVVDYQVVRLWEDLIEAMPAATEPVPADLVGFVASHPTDWATDETAEAETAKWWHGWHGLDLSYLHTPPRIRWWRSVADDDTVTVQWRHEPDVEITYTAPERGRVTMPTSEFIAGVRHLDGELLAAMRRRIADLERTGPPAGILIDMNHLRFEQQDRSTWLQRAIERPFGTDWAAVRTGARRLLPR